MEPTSNPDNTRSPRGLSRFWPVHREDEDPSAEAGPHEMTIARPGEPQMVALGSRLLPDPGTTPEGGPLAVTPVHGTPVPAFPGTPGVAFASASRGPSGPGGGPDRPTANGSGSSPTSGGPGGGLGGSLGGGFAGGLGHELASTGAGWTDDGPRGPSTPGGSGGSGTSGGPGGSAGLVGDGSGERAKDEAKAEDGGRQAAREGDPDHSGASETGEDAAQAIESSRTNPWDRDAGTFGGFGLGGRNGRFLFGGRTTAGEHRPGLNGHSGPELNGRPSKPDTEPSTVDDPAAEITEPATASDENGRDDMNGRAGVPGYPAPGFAAPGFTVPGFTVPGDAEDDADGLPPGPVPGTLSGRPGGAEPPAADPRRQATGWASVPTSTNPIVTPTSGAPIAGQPISGQPLSGQPFSGRPVSGQPFSGQPISGQPVSGSPVSGPPVSGQPVSGPPVSGPPVSGPPVSGPPVSGPPVSGPPVSGQPVSGQPISPGFTPTYGQPPSYAPALPDPAAGPVSGVPAPRAGASAPVSAPASASAPTSGSAPGSAPGSASAPMSAPAPAPALASAAAPAKSAGDVPPLVTPPGEPQIAALAAGLRALDDDLRPWDDENAPRPPAPRRSASLEDAEPVRRGRRAAPEPDDEPAAAEALRPGDVAAGHIAFWDDDATRHFRAAWHEVKAEFVDDPERALTRAHDLLTDAVNELTEALLAERDELDPLRGTATPDTESMRMAMRGYREFLDRILAL